MDNDEMLRGVAAGLDIPTACAMAYDGDDDNCNRPGCRSASSRSDATVGAWPGSSKSRANNVSAAPWA